MENKSFCLICEKEIELWDKKHSSTIKGGDIKVTFGFGSRYDWMGLRKPKYAPADPVLKDKPGYHEYDIGEYFGIEEQKGLKFYIPDQDAKVETIPYENLPEDKDIQVASSLHITAFICDDCFKKKIDFFHGTE